jgi:hypothetical protein
MEVIDNIDRVVMHYLKYTNHFRERGWFLIDFVAIFPIELIVGGGQ